MVVVEINVDVVGVPESLLDFRVAGVFGYVENVVIVFELNGHD